MILIEQITTLIHKVKLQDRFISLYSFARLRMLDNKRAIDIMKEVSRIKKLGLNPLEILDSNYREIEQFFMNAFKGKKREDVRKFVLAYRKRIRST